MGIFSVLELVIVICMAIGFFCFITFRLLSKCIMCPFVIKSFKTIKQTPSLRALNRDELRLLEPYLRSEQLVVPLKLQRTLLSQDIYALSMAQQKPINPESYAKKHYHTIAHIPFIFPYGIDEYLQHDSRIEFVLTKSYAIVVKVDNTSLIQSQEKIKELPEYAKLHWLLGYACTYQNNQTSDSFTILSQRELTPIERQTLQPVNNKANAFGLFILAFIFLLCAIFNTLQSPSVFLCLSLIFCIMFVISYLRKPPALIEKVNRIKGKITQHDSAMNNFKINNIMQFHYPAAWRSYVIQKTGQPVEIEADILVNAKEVIGIDHTLSLEQETLSSGKYLVLRQHVIFFIISALMSLCLFIVMPFKSDSLIYTYHQLIHNNDIIKINDNEQLQHTNDFALGDWVDIQGSGECYQSIFDTCTSLLIHTHNNANVDIGHNKIIIDVVVSTRKDEDEGSLYPFDIYTQIEEPFHVQGMISEVKYDATQKLRYMKINNLMLAQKSGGLLAKSAQLSYLFIIMFMITLIQFGLIVSKIYCNISHKRRLNREIALK